MVKKERLNFNVDANKDGDTPPRKKDDQENNSWTLGAHEDLDFGHNQERICFIRTI